jgi:hypothetical protein
MLFGLAQEGVAPSAFAKLSKREVNQARRSRQPYQYEQLNERALAGHHGAPRRHGHDVGTTAAETKDPEKSLPRAINSIPVRIIMFYVFALIAEVSTTKLIRLAAAGSPTSTNSSTNGLLLGTTENQRSGEVPAARHQLHTGAYHHVLRLRADHHHVREKRPQRSAPRS